MLSSNFLPIKKFVQGINFLNHQVASLNPNPLSEKKKRGKLGKIIRSVIFIIIVLVVLFVALRGLTLQAKKKQVAGEASQQNNQPLSQIVSLNKDFVFPALDDSAKKKGTINLKVTDVEKTDKVIVQDKTYTSQNNKVFLIVNLELKNESPKRLNIFPGDLIRLIVDDQEEKKLAPDLHNNYVLVAPISTKIDRVGFVVDNNFKNLKLQVGELEEKKEIIEIKFPSWRKNLGVDKHSLV